MEQAQVKAEWNCAPMEHGALYVMTYGMSQMQKLSVDNWVYPQQVFLLQVGSSAITT